MLAELRRLRIADYVRQHESGVVTVAELSQLLAVSDMTIRRRPGAAGAPVVFAPGERRAVTYQQSNGENLPLPYPAPPRPAKAAHRLAGGAACQRRRPHHPGRWHHHLQLANNLTCKDRSPSSPTTSPSPTISGALQQLSSSCLAASSSTTSPLPWATWCANRSPCLRSVFFERYQFLPAHGRYGDRYGGDGGQASHAALCQPDVLLATAPSLTFLL